MSENESLPTWEEPRLRAVEITEVESIADFDIAFASFCTEPTVDY